MSGRNFSVTDSASMPSVPADLDVLSSLDNTDDVPGAVRELLGLGDVEERSDGVARAALDGAVDTSNPFERSFEADNRRREADLYSTAYVIGTMVRDAVHADAVYPNTATTGSEDTFASAAPTRMEETNPFERSFEADSRRREADLYITAYVIGTMVRDAVHADAVYPNTATTGSEDTVASVSPTRMVETNPFEASFQAENERLDALAQSYAERIASAMAAQRSE